MANAIVSRIGQVNQSGPVDELFLKVWAGEVLTAFESTRVTKGRHMERTIENGKSATFPRMGYAEAYYHTVGEEILGGKINHAEAIITIDDTLLSPVFVANIDEAKNLH